MRKTPQSSNVHQLDPAASARLPNPFHPGSVKARCFDRYQRGGTNDALIADFRALGAAGTTARTLITYFRVFVRGMRAAREQGAAAQRRSAK